MSSRRRTIGIATVLMLAAALVFVTAPAGAGNPHCATDLEHPSCTKDEPATSVLYNVSMSLEGSSDGLSTEKGCTEDGHLVMVEEKLGSGTSLTAYGVDDTEPEADLWLVAPPITTDPGRCYSAYQGNFFDPEPGPGFFRIAFDRHGTLEGIRWHFDVAMEGMTVTHKYTLTSQNKKGRNSVSVTWVGPDADGALTGDGVVSGPFELWDYTDGPEWTLLAVLDLEFNLTIALPVP